MSTLSNEFILSSTHSNEHIEQHTNNEHVEQHTNIEHIEQYTNIKYIKQDAVVLVNLKVTSMNDMYNSKLMYYCLKTHALYKD